MLVLKIIILGILRGYKRFISPWLPQACRFWPTCSVYTYQAIEKYGICRGLWMALKRVAKCHPFHEGGFDPLT